MQVHRTFLSSHFQQLSCGPRKQTADYRRLKRTLSLAAKGWNLFAHINAAPLPLNFNSPSRSATCTYPYVASTAKIMSAAVPKPVERVCSSHDSFGEKVGSTQVAGTLNRAEQTFVESALHSALATLAQAEGSPAAELPAETCQQLLEEEPGKEVAEGALAGSSTVSQSGILSRPFVSHLARGLLQWHKAGRFPMHLPPIEGLQEDRSWEAELDSWTRKVQTGLGAMLAVSKVRKTALCMHVQEPWFSLLKSGAKSVEGRCARDAYIRLADGDTLLVNDSLLLGVKGNVKYDSFTSLLTHEGLSRVLPGCPSIAEGCAVYRAFYTEEQEKAAGVVALHVEPCPEDAQPAHHVAELLRELGTRPLLLLLRMRRTAGSIDGLLAPARSAMLAAFDTLNDPKNRLTVGARALTKHAHRCSHNWWGVPTGSEQAKNEHARAVVLRILDGAVWQNAHLLPHDVAVFEARVAEGYGARWSADGTQFRGFLEPQMEGGHERGWRH